MTDLTTGRRRRLVDRGLPLLVAAAAVLLACFGVADSDLFWHLEHGERMLDERSLVAEDDWSHTARGTSYAYYSWLAELVMAVVFRLGGLEAVVLGKALLAGLVVLLLSAALGARGVTGLPRAGVLLAALLLMRFRFYARPEIFTLLLLPAVDLCCLAWLDAGRRRALLALPVLAMFWANLHPFVIVGLGVPFAHALGGLLEVRAGLRPEPDRRALKLLGVTGLAAAASLINPWGWSIYAPVLKLWDAGAIGRLPTREWRPPTWEAFAPYFVIAAVATLLVLVTLKRSRIADLFLFAAGLVLSATALRNVGIFALLAAPAAGRALASLAGRFPLSARRLAVGAATQVLLLVALCGVLLSPHDSPLHLDESRHYRFGLGLARDSAPVAAVRFVEEHALEGPLWNSWAAGGYLIRECWPRLTVSLDGRQLPYERHLARLLEVGAARRIEELDIRLAVVLLDDRASVAGLRASGRHALVHFDDLAAVFVRDDALKSELAPYRALRADASDLSWMSAAPAAELAEALREADRAVRVQPDSSRAAMLRGLLLRRLGREEEGRLELERAVQLDPTQPTHRVNLGIARLDAGLPELAEKELREAVRLDRRSAIAHYDLALAQVDLGLSGAARRSLRRSLALDPDRPQAHLLLAGLELERGELAAVRRHAEAARRLAAPGSAVAGAAERLLGEASRPAR